MKTLAGAFFSVACLVSPLAASSGLEPRFSFDRSGAVGTFAIELPWPEEAAAIRIRSSDPSVVLVVPAERRASGGETAVFAGRYGRSGLVSLAFEIERTDGSVETRSIAAEYPETAAGSGVADRYARALLAELAARIERSGGDAFLGAAHEIVRRRHGLTLAEAPRPRSAAPPLPPLALYDVFTGALALEESLQLEALFADPPGDPRDRDVGVLSGPRIESHPFERMLEGRAHSVETSAAAVPADFLCARFRSIDALARAVEKFESWGSTLLATVAPSGRSPRLRERLETEIRFRLDDEWRRLLDPELESVSIVSSDPFVREGNDVTLVLEMKGGAEPAAAASAVARLARTMASPATGLAASVTEVRGTPVHGLVSADRRVSSHVASLGSFLVISNSLAATVAVLRTIAGDRPSLASLPEYRYMRSVLPRAADEDGFLYLSDAFVRRVVGPELKIVEARRVSCLARRSGLASAALLFRMENGRPPAGLPELAASLGLADAALACPDGGSLALDASATLGVCAVHGTGARSTPCLEIPCGRVSEAEAARYDRFVREYNNYWRRYFDPVAVRIRLDDGARLETVILPLIELSMYRDLKAAVGVAGAKPFGPARAPGEVYRLSGRFEPERLLAMAPFFPRVDLGGVADAARSALTGSFAVSRFDAEPLVEFEAADYLSRLLRSGAGFDFALVPLLSAVTAPTAVSIGTKDAASSSRFVESVRRALASANGSGRALSALPVVRHYVLDRPGGDVDSVSIEALSFRLRFFFAEGDGRIVIANRLDALESLLGAAAADGAAPSDGAEGEGGLVHDLELSIRADEAVRSRPFLEIGQAESAREACLANLEPVTALLEFGGVAAEAVEAETLRRFGDAFACPEGGLYAFDPASRAARCSRHGTLERPSQEMRPAGSAARLFSTLRDVRVRLHFTEEGLRTELIAK